GALAHGEGRVQGIAVPGKTDETDHENLGTEIAERFLAEMERGTEFRFEAEFPPLRPFAPDRRANEVGAAEIGISLDNPADVVVGDDSGISGPPPPAVVPRQVEWIEIVRLRLRPGASGRD